MFGVFIGEQIARHIAAAVRIITGAQCNRDQIRICLEQCLLQLLLRRIAVSVVGPQDHIVFIGGLAAKGLDLLIGRFQGNLARNAGKVFRRRCCKSEGLAFYLIRFTE